MSNLPIDLSDPKHLFDSIGIAGSVPIVGGITPSSTRHTDSVWTLTSSGSSGTFVLTINGVDTSALAYNANNGAVLAAVNAIAPNATVSGSAVSGTITDKTQELTIVVKTDSTNGTVAVAQTTAFAAGKIIGVMPKGFYAVSVIVSVVTAFDGTTPVLDVGTPNDLGCFAADVSLAVADTVDTTDSSLVTPIVKTAVTQKRYAKRDTNVVVGLGYGATAPTTGEAIVSILPWAV